MVTVVQLHPHSAAAALVPLAEGLGGAERELVARALEFAEPLYAGQQVSTGEPAWNHALGLAWVAHENLCLHNILRNAKEAQKAKYLPGLCGKVSRPGGVTFVPFNRSRAGRPARLCRS